MDREIRIANRIYIAAVVLLSTGMLVGAAFLDKIPHSFYA